MKKIHTKPPITIGSQIAPCIDFACPLTFEALFGVSKVDFTGCKRPVPKSLLPLYWHKIGHVYDQDQDKMAWMGELATIRGLDPYSVYAPLQSEAHAICQRLLRIDGQYARLPLYMLPYCGAFAAYGRSMTPRRVIKIRGIPQECHRNIIELYRSGETGGKIVTGFAMDGDGEWVYHSWIIQPNRTIVESTCNFQRYFGVALSKDGASHFCEKFLSEDWALEDAWVNPTEVEKRAA